MNSTPGTGLTYQPCAKAATYTAELPAAPTGVSWTVTGVYESTSASHDGVTTPALWTTGCSSGTGDWGVQEIQVTVVDGSRSLSRTVWKTYAWCYDGTPLAAPAPTGSPSGAC